VVGSAEALAWLQRKPWGVAHSHRPDGVVHDGVVHDGVVMRYTSVHYFSVLLNGVLNGECKARLI
jgi:hypothetical protein